jgi:adenosylcobinamide kinase/adenosylcobinamide-phosphate guanylyltransferase
VIYVATASPVDAEMAERIAHHRARRPPTWRTVEARFELAGRVSVEQSAASTLLIEDLTLLVSNYLELDEATAEARTLDEIKALLALDAHLIFVANEVGMGVVPAYPVGRVFRDAMGRINQAVAVACEEVHLSVAGLPLRLK